MGQQNKAIYPEEYEEERESPGDTLNHVTDVIRRSDIDWVHVRREEGSRRLRGQR